MSSSATCGERNRREKPERFLRRRMYGERIRTVLRKWTAVLLLLLLLIAAMPAMAELRVSFLDVGQGDAIALNCDGETLLIDAGPADAGGRVNCYLKDHGFCELKAVIATHSHDDHIGGMSAALTGISVGSVYSSRTVPLLYWFDTVQPVLAQSGLDVNFPEQNDTLQVGNAVVTVLSTDDPALSVNNRSTVVRVDYGSTSFLLMGDAEGDEETALLTGGAELKADVLKLGHHGGIGSTGMSLLDAVRPELAVISVGANNDHGHPAAETLALLESRGIRTCRTDILGTVTCISDGEKLTVEVEKVTGY